MLDSVAGVDFSAGPGEEIEVESTVAKSWLAAGLAEPVAKRATKSAEKRVTTDTESR